MSSSRRKRPVAVSGYRVPQRVTRRAIRSFLEALDTPRALAVLLLYESGEHEQLVNLECDPRHYDDLNPSKFRDDYAATKFLSKHRDLKTGIDLDRVALDGFWANEERCRETNLRMKDSQHWSAGKPINVWLHNATKRKIAAILRDNFNPDEWLDTCNWGPGATFHMKGRDTGPESKFLLEGGITHSLFPLVSRCFRREYPGWIPSLELTAGSRILTVPKTAKTNRVIAAEPGINLWFQLGVGNMISKRLRAFGIDLRHQDRNQHLAHYGSLSSSIATVDFSAASDTISYSVVEDLLPGDWFHALDLCRSPCSYVEGSWVELEKFSSMGNGFTFPLQTLIFFAAALAVCEYLGIDDRYLSVFGDDVIIPSGAFDLYVEFCAFLGFTANRLKSFSSDVLFRESCGAHYFRGLDVKPLYFKEAFSDVSSLYKFANAIKRLARRSFAYFLDGRFYSCWNYVYQAAPERWRFRIPKGVGDIGFEVGFDLATPDVRKADDPYVEGYTFNALVPVPVRRTAKHSGLLLARLRELGSDNYVYVTSPSLNGVRVRVPCRVVEEDAVRFMAPDKGNLRYLRRATKFFVKRIFANQWDDGGSWVTPTPPFDFVPA